MSFTSVDLPEPETPVTTVSNPSGKVTSTFFKLFALAPRIAHSRCHSASAAAAGTGYPRLAGQILPSERGGFASICCGRAGRHKMAAGLAGARAEIDDVIGAANGFFVVLDDEHGIAQIAQRFERR